MRTNTPDPFSGAPVWQGLHRGRSLANPVSSYGICVWWDYGYWVEAIARRVPFTNGTQVNVAETSKFFVETRPDEALAMLRRNGLRYVITDPSLPVFAGEHARVASMLRILDEPESRFYVALTDRSTGKKQVVFLPDYYRMMAVRLYLYDGQAVDKKLRIQLFELHPGDESSYDWTFEFQTEEAAREYMAANSSRKFLVGSLDSGSSCVRLDAVPWAKLAYSSDPLPISRERFVRAVKIFEVAGSVRF
jgi:asparagine N-glycosylation enzyme membrane subunit Stt3